MRIPSTGRRAGGARQALPGIGPADGSGPRAVDGILRSVAAGRDRAGTEVLAVAFAVGGALGYWLGGVLVGIALAVGACVVAGTAMAIRRMQRVGAALDSATDLSGLPPRQALAALGGATGAGAAFDSPQMRALETIKNKAERDPEGALTDCETLRDEFPRSPMVAGELSRRFRAVGREDAARRIGAQAIELALSGGMNPMAAKLLAELEDARDQLDLTPERWSQLAGAASAAGHEDAAQWCRARAADA